MLNKVFKVIHLVGVKKNLMNVMLFLNSAYNYSNSNKNNNEKIFFSLPKLECIRRIWTTAINLKDVTLS